MDKKAVILHEKEWYRLEQLLTEAQSIIDGAQPFDQSNNTKAGEGSLVFNDVAVVKGEA